MKTVIRNLYQQRFSRWLERRLPAAPEVTLNRRSLFIFPSSTGFAFFLLIILCWLAATNYENNLVFAVTCLLVSLFVVSILQCFANLSEITISCLKVTPGFAGQGITLELLLRQRGNRYRGAIQCRFPKGEMTTVSLGDSSQCRFKLTVPAGHRGLYNPGRLRIESVYPVGLLRAWSHVDLNISALVYPAPIFTEQVPVGVRSSDDGAMQGAEGGDDFLALKTYRPGDSLKHVAWKHYAREQGLHTKHYGDNFDQQLWLDWDQFPGLDREARLSRLCGMLLRVATTDQPYGLRLPGIVIEPDLGESHRQYLLAELALFDVPQRERQQ
ncbi:DUF58 domain-containing protein [Porticoccus litoralis]|uniref:DUF58 domain-containing protein n=1 Tax=Porticoccus litoralis TaxID=434086 RepID=A0AAW8AXU3_9GAMM|nr:DUF58 domain-containing protein [Porticoccus litoralis]MDP1519389.1 DUF58 domain-containing protein [Porticoccus litoralis]TNE84495.1 MAG: DUF58 domain-containing protein [Gammaproteobacteria bacterium]